MEGAGPHSARAPCRQVIPMWSHPAARRRMTAGTDTVGVLFNRVSDPFAGAMLTSMENELATTGRSVVVCNVNESLSRQADFLRKMARYRADGMIVCPAIGSTPANFVPGNLPLPPMVFVSRAIGGLRFDHVLTDDFEAARRATVHLLRLGHRRIAFVGGIPGTSCFGERMRGYRSALDGASVAFDPPLVRPGRPGIEEGFRAARRILELVPPPTAALCHDAATALGLSPGLERNGLLVGEHFALVSNEDVADAALTTPPLTATRVSTDELGRRAAAAVVERIENPHAPPRRIVLEPELVIRGSCGAAMPSRLR